MKWRDFDKGLILGIAIQATFQKAYLLCLEYGFL